MPGRKGDPLREYRRKRDPQRTPEPVPVEPPTPAGGDDTFVIQEHHARALHWDLRLEREGVLVSWAIPKGIPLDPQQNHLAVQTEDHPLEYASFDGDIPRGEYGGGHMAIWDRGRYETQKWSDREVMVVLYGARASGRYVLFHTRGKDWMIHRMDPAPAGWQPMPELLRPMRAVTDRLPGEQSGWAFELKWDGVRAIAYVDGGRVTLLSRNDHDVTNTYPEVRALGEDLGSMSAVLDGEIVALDEHGRPSFGRLQLRMKQIKPTPRQVAADPVVYVIFDILYLDGHPTTELIYEQRRELLDGLELEGRAYRTSPVLEGDAEDLLDATREQGLEGLMAKRRDSPYSPGERSHAWRKVKNELAQEVVIGGWKPGNGRRSDTIGALLLGIPAEGGLQYIGKVGTGFTRAMLEDLHSRLIAISRKTSPFLELTTAEAKDARWCTPRLVGEVSFSDWTPEGRLRHPSWRGLRPDKSVEDVEQ
jgi:bifunctional non-homologous end joining protein LigD